MPRRSVRGRPRHRFSTLISASASRAGSICTRSGPTPSAHARTFTWSEDRTRRRTPTGADARRQGGETAYGVGRDSADRFGRVDAHADAAGLSARIERPTRLAPSGSILRCADEVRRSIPTGGVRLQPSSWTSTKLRPGTSGAGRSLDELGGQRVVRCRSGRVDPHRSVSCPASRRRRPSWPRRVLHSDRRRRSAPASAGPRRRSRVRPPPCRTRCSQRPR